MAHFHIHIDGHRLPPCAREAISNTPFEETPFRRDLMCDGFEAPHHYTLKTQDSRVFKTSFENIVGKLHDTDFAGYVEGEFIAYDQDVSYEPGRNDSLDGIITKFASLPAGGFRETELHITLRKTEQIVPVTNALRKIGFFSAFMDKTFGLAEILTLQGSKDAVMAIEGIVIDYLRSRKEIENCSIKREDVARYWLSTADIKRAPTLIEVNR